MICYADTSWWLAIKNADDANHPSALGFFDQTEESQVVWTPWHRVEVFNALRQMERVGALKRTKAATVIRSIEQEIRLGYWPHVEFRWTEAVRTACELSAEYSKSLLIRGMDLFHIAVALEVTAECLLTFDSEQASLATAAGLSVWNG